MHAIDGGILLKKEGYPFETFAPVRKTALFFIKKLIYLKKRLAEYSVLCYIAARELSAFYGNAIPQVASFCIRTDLSALN